MDWWFATDWVAGLNPYGSGITGWRLPTVSPVDGTTLDDSWSYNGTEDLGHNVSAPGTLYAGSTASEMAHLFYNTLGNKSPCDPTASTESFCSPQTGWGLTNTGPFVDIQSSFVYWSATEYEPYSNEAWFFGFSRGIQSFGYKTGINGHAWAVHAGDVGAAVVPVPAAAWLFGSGLLGLLAMARKRRS